MRWLRVKVFEFLLMLVVFLVVLLSCNHCIAGEASPERCVSRLIQFNIINNFGPPAYFATLNGRKVVGFISPRTTTTNVYESGSFHFPSGEAGLSVGLTGETRDVHRTYIDSLLIGNAHFKDIPAFALQDSYFIYRGDPPAILILGSDIFSNMSVLFDQDAGKIFLFKYRHDDCGSEGDLLSGRPEHIPLWGNLSPHNEVDLIKVLINGKVVEFQILFSQNNTIMTDYDYDRVMRGRDVPDKSDDVVTIGNDIIVGKLRTINNMKIGNIELNDVPVDVMSGAGFNAIGADILNRFNILFDASHNEMWLTPRSRKNDPSRSFKLDWWPNKTRIASTHVYDRKH